MEYFGIIAFILIMCYAFLPGKIKHLEKKLAQIERKQKGDHIMSKLMDE